MVFDAFMVLEFTLFRKDLFTVYLRGCKQITRWYMKLLVGCHRHSIELRSKSGGKRILFVSNNLNGLRGTTHYLLIYYLLLIFIKLLENFIIQIRSNRLVIARILPNYLRRCLDRLRLQVYIHLLVLQFMLELARCRRWFTA